MGRIIIFFFFIEDVAIVRFPMLQPMAPYPGINRWEALSGLSGSLKKLHEVEMGYVDEIWVGVREKLGK